MGSLFLYTDTGPVDLQRIFIASEMPCLFDDLSTTRLIVGLRGRRSGGNDGNVLAVSAGLAFSLARIAHLSDEMAVHVEPGIGDEAEVLVLHTSPGRQQNVSNTSHQRPPLLLPDSNEEAV